MDSTQETRMAERLSVWSTEVPGGNHCCLAFFDALADARAWCRRKFAARRDLRYQDVVIRGTKDGRRIEFAGPPR